MAINRHEDAAETFSYLRKDYPGSEHLFNSEMLELESRLKSYRGPDYDGSPLVEAERLRNQIVKQFPQESSQHMEILNQQDSLITNQLAQRDVRIGEFYEGKGQNLAAKIYYEKVQEDHSNTIFENDISQKIATVAAKPATPATACSVVDQSLPRLALQRSQSYLNVGPNNLSDRKCIFVRPESSSHRDADSSASLAKTLLRASCCQQHTPPNLV